MTTRIFKLCAGFYLLALLPVMTVAQDLKNSTPESRAKTQTEWMKSTLSLDPSVIPSVNAINLKYAQKIQAVIASDDSKFQKYRSVKSLSDAKDKELKSIFTKEQYTIYQQKKEEKQQKMKQKLQEYNK